MGKTTTNHSTAEAVLAAIDVTESAGRHTTNWTVMFECPGRMGRFSRTWSNPLGRMDADQARDLSTWVANSVSSALVAWGGVQEVLET